jgi:tetratricopeptide (TPR) repeat protein
MFARIELPDHRDKTFEDFMLRGVDFRDQGHGQSQIYPAESGGDLQYHLEHGNEKYFNGFYLDALKHYAQVLRVRSETIDAWIGQIRILVDADRIEAAIFWSDVALERSTDTSLLELAKAYALACAGKSVAAKSLINKPVRKDEPAMSWLLRGEVLIRIRLNLFSKIFKPYRGIGKIGSFFCFLKALELNPRDGFINQRIGIAYLLADGVDLAHDPLRTALIMSPQNPLTLLCLAMYYCKKGNYEYALYYAKKSIAFNPELDGALELMYRLNSPGARFTRWLGIKR